MLTYEQIKIYQQVKKRLENVEDFHNCPDKQTKAFYKFVCDCSGFQLEDVELLGVPFLLETMITRNDYDLLITPEKAFYDGEITLEEIDFSKPLLIIRKQKLHIYFPGEEMQFLAEVVS